MNSKKPAENKQPNIELNACSAYDCTGLIPSAINDESEIEAYEEIYHYLSPNIGDSSDSDNEKT